MKLGSYPQNRRRILNNTAKFRQKKNHGDWSYFYICSKYLDRVCSTKILYSTHGDYIISGDIMKLYLFDTIFCVPCFTIRSRLQGRSDLIANLLADIMSPTAVE